MIKKIILSFLLISWIIWWWISFWSDTTIDGTGVCLQFATSTWLQDLLDVSEPDQISCYKWDKNEATSDVNSITDFSLKLKFNISNSDNLLLASNNGVVKQFNGLDTSKTYSVELTSFYDKNSNIQNATLKIIDNNWQVVQEYDANKDWFLPKYDIKNINILWKKWITNISNLSVLYNTNDSADKTWYIKINGINGSDWYSSDWNCWTDNHPCTRKYFYNWEMWWYNKNILSSIVLNVFYDYNGNNTLDNNSELVYTYNYNLTGAINLSNDDKLSFNTKYKELNIDDLTNLKFSNWLQILNEKNIWNNIVNNNFIKYMFDKQN